MRSFTVETYIQAVLEKTHSPKRAKTVDTLKCGDLSAPVRGVVTTFMPTRQVLEKAVALGANLIVPHEPIFYNHLDETDWLKGDGVFEGKQRFLKENNLAVWRFHDSLHDRKPDGIVEGMMAKLGWKEFQAKDNPRFLEFPGWSAKKIALSAKEALGLPMVRLAGDPEAVCGKVATLFGAWGGEKQINDLKQTDVKAIVCGESPEWETCEYVRDAVAQGRSIAMIVLGHAPSEESGMEYVAELLRNLIPEVPVHFIPAGNPFQVI